MSTSHPLRLVATLIAAGMLSACSGVSTNAPTDNTPTVSVRVSAPNVASSLAQGSTVQVYAYVLGTTNQAVTWSIREGTAGGTVSGTGLYTAPAAAMDVHVIATSVADPTKSGSIALAVSAVHVHTLSTVSVPRGRQRQFSSWVEGTVVQDVTWTLVEGAAGGTLSVDGLYTAPESGGPFHVIARSVADPSQTATAVVVLTDTGFRKLNASMVEPRISPTLTLLLNGKVLIAGGGWCKSAVCTGWDPLASAELFDPATETFSSTGPMSVARAGHTATLLSDGTVLIVGGANPAIDAEPTAEIYDPRAGSFTRIGRLARGRIYHTASLLADGRVLIAGGWQGRVGNQGFPPTQTAEVYDPATRSFSPVGNMPKETESHTATVLLNGTVLVVGGKRDTCTNGAPGITVFNPAGNSFNAGAALLTPRARHTATALNDGRVLVAGGVDPCDLSGFPESMDSAVVFNPSTGAFSPELRMSEPRSGHSAVLLKDGRVLLVGSSAELFDPATSTFTITGDPNASGYWDAVCLSDGRVLIVDAGLPAEIYEY